MVNIWQEPWLRKQGHGYVETPMVEGLEDMTVADIVSHQNDSWNLDIINQILIPDDIIDVTHTLVPSLMADDKLKWAETNGVVYTMLDEPNQVRAAISFGACGAQLIHGIIRSSIVEQASNRGSSGVFVETITQWRSPRLYVLEGETRTLCVALDFVLGMGLSNVIFEMDKTIVDKVHYNSLNETEVGIFIRECRIILDSNQTFNIGFLRRQHNGVAHASARVAPYFSCSQYSNHAPTCVLII
ncbi:hypothetical protein HKD37_15G044073 [Glycine soja]